MVFEEYYIKENCDGTFTLMYSYLDHTGGNIYPYPPAKKLTTRSEILKFTKENKIKLGEKHYKEEAKK